MRPVYATCLRTAHPHHDEAGDRPCAAAPQPQQQPPGALKRLGAASSSVHGLVAALEQRLTPILRPLPAAGCVAGPRASSADDAEPTLPDYIEGIGRAAGRLAELLDRIDL